MLPVGEICITVSNTSQIVQNAKADLVGKEINDFEGATARRYILPLTIEVRLERMK